MENPFRIPTFVILSNLLSLKFFSTARAISVRQSSGIGALFASEESAAQPSRPESANSWLCRISGPYEACGTRQFSGVEPPLSNTYCPERFCCSKTACFTGCGSWCHDNWALCSSSIVYHPEWSYGNCNCNRFGENCHKNADCIHLNEPRGGAYCKCRAGYYGDGKECTVDACFKEPCGVGECKTVADGYDCICPETHKVVTIAGRKTCQEKPNYCIASPCGPPDMVKQCVNRDDGFDCECNQGYEVKNGRCEEVDMCANSQCGPPEAVHECITEREPFLRRRCQCRTGYSKKILSDGVSETCVKDWCYGDPCGGRDIVASCSSKEDFYSCLCKDGYIPSTESGHEKCTKDDICRQQPCGTPEAAKNCYAHGSSYSCECQPGYAELLIEGKNKCQKGDPCVLGACGPAEAVEECSTDGTNYSCVCNANYMLSMHNGRKVCLSEADCIENCGPIEYLQSCEIQNERYICACKPGHILKYRDGKRMCAEGDVCSTSPCGSEEAVESCTPTEKSYSCTCKEGFELRTTLDGAETCVEPDSCIGNPCGPPEIVKSCISENGEYTCRCQQGYEVASYKGRSRCVSSETASSSVTDVFEKSGGGTSNYSVAGGIIGGLLLLSVIGGAVMYAKSRRTVTEEEVEDGQRAPLFPPTPGMSEALPHVLPEQFAEGPAITMQRAGFA